jgi:AraC-like DNA-binding protein
LHGSKRINPFCAMMEAQNQSCSECLLFQHRIESEAADAAKTMECFAGLSESAVPVRQGERVIGFLRTGQVFLSRPSATRLHRLQLHLMGRGSIINARRLEAAYFATRVVSRGQYASFLRLLAIFALHLANLANQLMVKQAMGEAPEVSRARRFIFDHMGERITLGQTAKASGMSTFYFCKYFKQATGLTFLNYLGRIRIESVKKILLNPHKRVSEAAFEVGFQSLSQFNRVFRRVAGESPSGYRDKIHGSSAALQQAGTGELDGHHATGWSAARPFR